MNVSHSGAQQRPPLLAHTVPLSGRSLVPCRSRGWSRSSALSQRWVVLHARHRLPRWRTPDIRLTDPLISTDGYEASSSGAAHHTHVLKATQGTSDIAMHNRISAKYYSGQPTLALLDARLLTLKVCVSAAQEQLMVLRDKHKKHDTVVQEQLNVM
jgi:hypothetical protein